MRAETHQGRSANGKREALLTESEAIRAALLAAAAGLPPADGATVFLGAWSAEDLVAHLTGWDWINLGAMGEVQAGCVPSFYALHDSDWAALNRHLVAEFKVGPLPALVRAARASHSRLMGAARSLPRGNLERDFGVRVRGVRVTIARLLRWELADERTHLVQLRDFTLAVGSAPRLRET